MTLAFGRGRGGLLALSGGLRSPGWGGLPTVRPITRADVDMAMREGNAVPPTLPTCAAWRMDSMPSTIVQEGPG